MFVTSFTGCILISIVSETIIVEYRINICMTRYDIKHLMYGSEYQFFLFVYNLQLIEIDIQIFTYLDIARFEICTCNQMIAQITK